MRTPSRRASPLLGAVLALAVAVGSSGTARAAARSVATPYVDAAVRALADDPVYLDPDPRTLPVDARVLRAALRGEGGPVVVAVLPAAAARDTGGDPAALPGAIAAALARPPTVVVVAGRWAYAASTQLPPDRLAAALERAGPALASPRLGRAGATAVVADLLRDLDPRRQPRTPTLGDPPGPRRAGSPVGPPLLVVTGVGLLAGGVLLVLRLRRPARPVPPPPRPRTRVEVDAYGHIVRRIPADRGDAPQRPVPRE
ncbi:MAG TPA: hypothetical protein VKP11_12530 [Frankiaceae bacterium]|nr:hypothetical protein [Frankiaceae bacterium]